MRADRAVRAWVRDAVAAGLWMAGLSSPRRRAEGRLTVVTFHRVLPADLRDRYPLPGLVVTPEELDWLLGYFTKVYACGSLSEQLSAFTEGTRESKPRLAITFDDGQLDNYEHARPVLARHALGATFYIPVDAVESGVPLWHDRLGFAALAAAQQRETRRALGSILGDPSSADHTAQGIARQAISFAKQLDPEGRTKLIEDVASLTGTTGVPPWAGLMTWTEVRELAKAGHEIGSHSMSHPLLPQCSRDRIRHETGASREALEAQVEAPVVSFCYPDGAQDDRCVEAVREAGYANAVTTRWGLNGRTQDRFSLKRCDMHPGYLTSRAGRMSEARLAWRFSGLHPGLSR